MPESHYEKIHKDFFKMLDNALNAPYPILIFYQIGYNNISIIE
jgi:hypothetical protein